MSNTLKFILKKEVELNEKFQPITNEKICLYAICNEISSCVTEIKTYEEALSLIHPDKILELFKYHMSGDELDIFKALLAEGTKYYFLDKELIYGVPKETRSSISLRKDHLKGQQLIGKIIKATILGCKYTVIAEGVEWVLYSANNLKVGNFVLGNVQNDENDEDNFYLVDSKQPLSNEDEWKKQEELSLV